MLRGFTSCVCVAVVLAAGCGDDSTAPPGGGFDAGPRPDGGPRDGGAGDGALPDGASPDGAIDAGGTGSDGGLPSSCTLDPDTDRVKLSSDTIPTGRVIPAVASSTGGFAAVWSSAPLGLEDIYGRLVPQTGAAPDVVNLSSDSALSRAPALVAMGTGYLVVWYDNRSGNFEIYAQAADASLGTTGSVEQLTMNTSRDDQPALVRMGGGALSAWVNDDSAGSRVVYTRLLDATGSPAAAAAAVTAAPYLPDTPLLTVRSGGAALFWTESRAAGSHVYLLPLDVAGAADGTPQQIDTAGDVDGTLDVDLVESGGAVVFGVNVGGSRPEVRFRRLAGDGTLMGDESILTPAPERATSPSIVRYRGGYAVTYRSISGSTAMIRLALVDAGGTVVHRFDVAAAQPDGGRTTVRGSADGTTLIVTWSDVALADTSFEAARVHCE